MAAYARALHSFALSGPTLFGPVINTAAEIAAHSYSHNSSKYFILLIITVRTQYILHAVLLCMSLIDGMNNPVKCIPSLN